MFLHLSSLSFTQKQVGASVIFFSQAGKSRHSMIPGEAERYENSDRARLALHSGLNFTSNLKGFMLMINKSSRRVSVVEEYEISKMYKIIVQKSPMTGHG